jgi:acetyltransferase
MEESRMSAKTHPKAESAHDIFRAGRGQPLEAIFAPRSVAVIGASEKPGSVGRALAENLRLFEGKTFLINPKHTEILQQRTFPHLGAVPEPIDLALIATPAATVPGLVNDCAKAGIGGVIIISAGFKEIGPAGEKLEQQIKSQRGQLRLIGPNCLGVMRPHAQLNATFAQGMAKPGSVAFISQSGALCTAVLDWSLRENVGFSSFVSIGSMLDVDWGDLITYFGDDPYTKSIVCYMESVGDARSFLSAAREVALSKPVIVLKVGRTEAAAKAAASHTGALAGRDAVLDAAFHRAGVLRVNTIEELFDMAEVLAKQPRPRGPHLAIITNAGGPAALATDALVSSGGQLATLSSTSLESLNAFLPPHWSHGNPVDILGDADAGRYAQAVELAAKDAQVDGVLAVLTPQAMTESTATAEQLKRFAKLAGKPFLASWMGGPAVEAGETILNAAGIPTFKYPDRAARTFSLMWQYSERLRSLYETPTLRSDRETANRAAAEQLIARVRATHRTLLTEAESKQVLAAYGIATVPTHTAATEAEAVQRAESIGYPVVLKLLSETLTHKTDVGGVELDLRSSQAVQQAWQRIRASVIEKAGPAAFLGVTVQPMIQREGYELILGSSIDPQFGPVLLFGLGGQLVEVLKDRALGLPPLNATLARRLMEQTRIYTALRGVRGRAAIDLDQLAQLLVRFSELIAEQPWIAEADINPLLVSPAQMLALDARIVLHPSTTREDQLPRLAIRPYPARYIAPWKLKDGSEVLIRPIRPEDEPLLVKFHHTLSERSVYLRYFAPLKLDQRIAHERLSRLCFIDYDREMALVVERRNFETQLPEVLGVGRLSKLHGTNEAEFALTISDQWQGHGLGTQLLKTLVQMGRDEKLQRITATILPDNRGMQQVARKVGFTLSHPGGEEVTAVIQL